MDQRRFILFLLLSFAILTGYTAISALIWPPPPKQRQVANEDQPAPGEDGAKQGAPGEKKPQDDLKPPADDRPDPAAPPKEKPPRKVVPQAAAKSQVISLGSADPNGPYRMVVYLNNRGAAVELIELTSAEYRSLDDLSDRNPQNHGGYLGYLVLKDVPQGRGCQVGVVGLGTPAASAASSQNGTKPGLRRDDIILAVDAKKISSAEELHLYLGKTQPDQKIQLQVERKAGGKTKTMTFSATLGRRPLKIIQPQWDDPDDPDSMHPLSFLFTLQQLGNQQIAFGQDEIQGLPSLHNSNWEVIQDPKTPDEVAFRMVVRSEPLEPSAPVELEIIKRYRLARDSKAKDKDKPAYHLTLRIEIRNLGQEEAQFAYQIDGPAGLPLEGWWYINKVSPDWGGAGVRDVLWRSSTSKNKLFRCAVIVSKALKDAQSPLTPMFDEVEGAQMLYAGVDSPYFSVVMMPDEQDESYSQDKFRFSKAVARAVADIDKDRKTRSKDTDVSFRLTSRPLTIGPNETFQQSFRIFAGPKKPELLDKYNLKGTLEYGWFEVVAKPMLMLLHFFYGIVGNYGLAIIMLTVMVRGCMFPLGRKMARNAQKMQELAPEMKQLAEMYKKDMEKRAKAQQELFRKHKYNPLGGCWLVFLQLPIFIGLYRSLSVAVELRQSPLIPGLSWCSNLAGPDKLWYWEPHLPAMIAGPTGWLGPYFNILPLITIALFIVHQKLFTPPATDDQAKMQQQMMMFMMLFMGVMFFKVPSGLCIYFIASSLWGVAERLLLPKPAKKEAEPALVSINGPSKKGKRKKGKGKK